MLQNGYEGRSEGGYQVNEQQWTALGKTKPRLADDSHSLCRKEQNVSKEVEKEISGHREVPPGP